MKLSLTTLVLVGLFLTACGGDAADLDAEADQAAAEVEEQVERLGDEIETSQVRQDLESAWAEVQEEVTRTAESIRSGEQVETDEFERRLDEFETQLESVDAEETLREAWRDLRETVEELLAGAG